MLVHQKQGDMREICCMRISCWENRTEEIEQRQAGGAGVEEGGENGGEGEQSG